MSGGFRGIISEPNSGASIADSIRYVAPLETFLIKPDSGTQAFLERNERHPTSRLSQTRGVNHEIALVNDRVFCREGYELD